MTDPTCDSTIQHETAGVLRCQGAHLTQVFPTTHGNGQYGWNDDSDLRILPPDQSDVWMLRSGDAVLVLLGDSIAAGGERADHLTAAVAERFPDVSVTFVDGVLAVLVQRAAGGVDEEERP